jgi:anti-repressor protein
MGTDLAIQLFHHRGITLRTVVINSEPWFVAADACGMLTLRDTTSAMKMVAPDEKQVLRRSDTPHLFEGIAPQVQMMTVVNESGLYSLIFQSDKAEAVTFRRWITGDVLPAIRRTGSYGTAPALQGPELLARAVLEAQAMLAAKDERIAELEPRAQVGTKLLDAEGDLSVRDAAQCLTRAGIKVGAGRLFARLEQRGWIKRAMGDGRYRVMQSAVETGYMSVLPQSHYHPKTGELVLDPPQPRVTPKGLQRLLADYESDVAS